MEMLLQSEMFNIISIAVLLSVFFFDRKQVRSAWDDRLFNELLGVVSLLLLLDGACRLLNGYSGAIVVNGAFHTLRLILHALFGYLWLLYADGRCRGGKPPRADEKWLALPMLLQLLLLLVTPLTGFVFSLDATGAYVRGAGFALFIGLLGLCMLGATGMAILVLLRDREPPRRSQAKLILLFSLPPMLGWLLQLCFDGVSFLWIGMSYSLLMIYLNRQSRYGHEQALALERMKNEVLQSGIAIMLSQIQPHFLYNALNTIGYLCESDPEAAGQAIDCFSKFLRSNMDSLKQSEPIPFEKELEHVRNYVYIEELRFGKRISVVYDLAVTDFKLPALTVQPLVENAIRYGVTQRVEGGTVTVATKESDACVYLSVSDDGVGFDPLATQSDGRSHIGLSGTRDRIALLCGGSLAVDSQRGVGTRVTITLPKKEGSAE